MINKRKYFVEKIKENSGYKNKHIMQNPPQQVTCIREGYRSVPLKNGYSEEIELASLLVHMKITREVRSVNCTMV